MEISELTIKILLLFLPGILTNEIVQNLTVVKDKQQPFYFLITSFLFGFLCYFLYYLIVYLLDLTPWITISTQLKFLQLFSKEEFILDYWEIILVCIIAFFNSLFFSFLINNEIFLKIARKLGITRKFGGNSVWAYLLNSFKTEWVIIRDFQTKLMYEGWIQFFSDEYEELFLRDVIVYSLKDGKKLNQVEGIYLRKDSENITIEFIKLINLKNKRKEKKYVRRK